MERRFGLRGLESTGALGSDDDFGMRKEALRLGMRGDAVGLLLLLMRCGACNRLRKLSVPPLVLDEEDSLRGAVLVALSSR